MDKQTVNAYREEWRYTRVSTYWDVKEVDRGLHRESSGLDRDGKKEDLRAATAAKRLLQSVAIDHKGPNKRGAETTQGIDRADGGTSCEGDGRNPVQHPL